MAYKRKTRTREELSAACRRAAMARKNRRGGRPRSDSDNRPPQSVKLSALHYEMLKNIANAHNRTLKSVAEALVRVYVNGTTSPIHPHPQFMPNKA